MKQIYILRHANWNLDNGRLTDEGKQKCLGLKDKLLERCEFNKLRCFDIIISSDFNRTKETARLLTGLKPKIDKRAGILKLTKEQNKQITELRQRHPLGVVGVIFSIPELTNPLKQAGQNLIKLINEILAKLPKNGNALIISHDGTMISAEKILRKETFASVHKTYYGLEGFIVDEKFHIKKF